MKEILFLGSKGYENDGTTNYGDCILINTGSQLVIYDCGSEQHADRVIEYMERNSFDQAELVLSHNDGDHFNGIPKLVEAGKISRIHTICLLKYLEEILVAINDGRKNRDSLRREIKEKYENIASLVGCNLLDIYGSSEVLCDAVSIVGPDKKYVIDAVAKQLDSREGNMIDNETAFNATSVQVSVKFDNHRILLTGDASFEAIGEKVCDYDVIQLPHHGKKEQAEEIYKKKNKKIDTIYIVSDNTGDTNGGSDKLETKGHRVYVTKSNGDIVLNKTFFDIESPTTGRSLCIDEIYSIAKF